MTHMSGKHTKAMLKAAAAAAALAMVAPLPFATAPAHADEEVQADGNYLQAFRSYHAGDYRTARIQLLNALKENPNNALARVLQARVALARGNGVEAETELERAVSAGIAPEKVRHLRAHALLLQNKPDQARELLEPNRIPDQFAGYAARLRGQIAAAEGELETAEREFNRALALGPDDPQTVVIAAKFMGAAGQAEAGRRLLADFLRQRPGHIESLIAMGELTRRSEGLEASLPYFSRAIEVDRNNVNALLERAATLGDLQQDERARADLQRVNRLVDDHPVALYLEAVLETRAGNMDRARTLMTETSGRLRNFAPAMMLQGLLALDVGNVEQANAFLGNLVGRVPNSITARKLYATAQLQKNDAQGALETLRPIIDADAADARVYALAGSALARSGRTEQAQEYLQQAQELSGDTAVQNQLAMTQLLGGETELAEETVRSVLDKDRDSLAGLMMLTLINLQSGDMREAKTVSDRIVKAYPDLPIGYNLRGGALLGLNDRDGAEASFRAALQRKEDYPEARRNLAQLLIAKGDEREAKTQLRRVVSDNSGDTRALMMLAQLAAREGDRAEQREWLQQAASVDRDAPGPRIALTEAYIATGDENRAQNEAAALLRDFPRQPQALLAAARTYEATGRRDQLVSIFNRMVSVQPNSLAPRLLLGRAQNAVGDVDTARRTFERALTITGENTAPAYLELIALEAREGRLDKAREWAIRLRGETPDSNVAENALGRAYLLADRPQDALAAFAAARKKRFDLNTARGIAEAYVGLGRRSDALGILQSYRKANPDDAGALNAVAEIHLEAGDYRRAAANYETLRKTAGADNAAILNNLAYSYLKLGDPRAVQMARRAYNLAPRSGAIADTYGLALLKSGEDKEEALQLLRRAARMQPDNPEIRYHLAQAYLANGQRAEALKAVRSSLRSGDEFAEQRQARALLRRLGG